MYMVIGSNGFLGSYVVKTLCEKSTEPVTAVYRGAKEWENDGRITVRKCDVTDYREVRALRDTVEDVGKCKIFYFAACHNLDVVKREPENARKINIDALQNFLNEFSGAKRLYFSSTDCVYGENTDEYPSFKENDPTNPDSEYGRQKLEAESLVTAHGFNVVRLPFMLGKSLLKNKKHFYDNIITNSRNGEKVTLADGLIRSALDYESVAEILFKLVNAENVPQILNLCGDDALTKYDVGVLLEKKFKLPHENIVKVNESEIRKLFYENRTSSTVMDNSLLKSILGVDEIKIKI